MLRIAQKLERVHRARGFTALATHQLTVVTNEHHRVINGKRQVHSGVTLSGFTEGWSPIVLMQNTVEAAHIYGHMPWWYEDHIDWYC